MKLFLLTLFTSFFLNAYCQLDKLDFVISQHVKNGFNGNLMYVRSDTIQYIRNCGTLDFQRSIPINDSSLFELGFNTMQFTAVAIIQLIEAGKIKYSTNIEDIFPFFPYNGITIEHLLRHQSGLPSLTKILTKKRDPNKNKIVNNQDLLKSLITKPPATFFPAGKRHKFSYTNYVILALIVEQVSQKSFPTYLKENIFDVAGMNHTRIIRSCYDPQVIPNNTVGYNFHKKKNKSKVKNSNPKSSSFYLDGLMGDRNISSTLLDMKKWNSALKTDLLISTTNKNKMFSVDSISVDYGFGFCLDPDDGYIYHGGSWSGYSTWTFYKKKSDEYFVVFCNNSYPRTRQILTDMLDNTPPS